MGEPLSTENEEWLRNLDPDDAHSWRIKSVALGNLGRYTEALEAAGKAIGLEPDDAANWWLKGWALYELGRYTEALEAAEKSIALKTGDAAACWELKGVVLYSLGRFAEALEAAGKAIGPKPDNADTWRLKGLVLYSLGRYSEALEAAGKAVALKPDDASALNIKAVILMEIGRTEEAVKLLKEALERGTTDTFAFNLAVALIRLERCAEAEQALSRAIRLASGAKDRKKGQRLNEYRSALRSLRSRTNPIMWWAWWFAEGGSVGWLKRIVAGFSLLLLGVYVLLPLVAFNTDLLKIQGREWWINAGAGWESYIVPVAAILIVLLSPMLRKLGAQGVELSPILPPPESEVSRKWMNIQPKL